jgi:SAM-dependent methyltransferase
MRPGRLAPRYTRPVATDVADIVSRLTAFYDFTDRTIVAVGAGGGQLAEYARGAARVIAVDPDVAAMDRLRAAVDAKGLIERYTFLRDDFRAVRPRGDVVLFEFCLHLLPDPECALVHASQLAPDVVVLDHAPGSQWMWCASEESGVAEAWSAVARRDLRRTLDVRATQRFRDFSELEARLAAQPSPSGERIVTHRGQRDIAIDMPYRLALI